MIWPDLTWPAGCFFFFFLFLSCYGLALVFLLNRVEIFFCFSFLDIGASRFDISEENRIILSGEKTMYFNMNAYIYPIFFIKDKIKIRRDMIVGYFSITELKYGTNFLSFWVRLYRSTKLFCWFGFQINENHFVVFQLDFKWRINGENVDSYKLDILSYFSFSCGLLLFSFYTYF